MNRPSMVNGSIVSELGVFISKFSSCVGCQSDVRPSPLQAPLRFRLGTAALTLGGGARCQSTFTSFRLATLWDLLASDYSIHCADPEIMEASLPQDRDCF